MKVGILTFPHSPSLGAMLQMGSLYHVIEEMGHEVEIINYVSNKVNHQQKRPMTMKTIAIHILSKLFLKSSRPSFQEFEARLQMFPEQPVSEISDLSVIENRFDRIIVGSDQVWNPVVTGHDLNFYLEFCKDPKKKASYAASFGYMQADQNYIDRITELLNDFSYLSVRERDGQQIIKDLTGRNSKLVLDPTLLVSEKYLRSIMVPNARSNKYVLFFCIKPSSKLYDTARVYAEKNGYELLTIGGRMKDRLDPRKHPVFGAGPKEFLGLINGAQCVFTNSFHGMAISVALHRDFYVEFSSDTNSRLINLTELLGLGSRVVKDEPLYEKRMDYSNVDIILDKEREVSMNYLKEVLH